MSVYTPYYAYICIEGMERWQLNVDNVIKNESKT